ncbi:hypothetical protein NW762_006359 [Fusarium torreyae]|uniref:Uncharacterized protein n=1 Tax=Fusarium torreyae TaxID=1237075 RepID=A0A9W8VHI4_9HYPO|nr:hypothetical protein NW762_006359 [Fusarium torreyae]
MSDLLDSQKASQQAEAGITNERPSWLKYLEDSMEEEKDELYPRTAHWEIVRDLLLASEADDITVPKATQRLYDDYIAEFSDERCIRQPPEYGAGGVLNSISAIVFDMVTELTFTDPKHDTLSKFLISVAKNAATEFDIEHPRFVYHSWGIQVATRESWDAYHADSRPPGEEGPVVVKAIDTWLSVAALIAKLFQADLLEEYGPLWVRADFERAFETRTEGDVTKDPIRQAQILTTANYILLAGEAFAGEAKRPPPKERWYELNATKWKFWASKLQEVAETVGDDALGNLKHRAQEAHDKMVELYPEAFNTQ